MQDRVSLYPGRVKLKPVAGEADTFDLVRADQPTQEGTPLNKATLLKDATAALLGLPKTAVPDDAFVALVLGQGVYGYRVRVQLADGTPVEGATVSGIQPLTGSTLVTGADGTVLGKSTSASVTIGCSSPYIDQRAPAAQTVTKTGTITDVTLTLENITDILKISDSRTAKTSSMLKAIDVTTVGGGGGGGGDSSGASSPLSGGGGGGGGYANTVLNYKVSSATLTFRIGAGGNSSSSTAGSDGGMTSLEINGGTVCFSAGGKGGGLYAGGSLGGSGNGKGGDGSGGSASSKTGRSATKYIFDDTSLGLAGGGGGGGCWPRDGVSYAGGSPNGGASGYHDSGNFAAVSGSFMGGGGGGGIMRAPPGSGGGGGMYIRFHFDSTQGG